MADSHSKTEKATPRRLEKARREGQFASSRELVAATQFVVFVTIMSAAFPGWLTGMKQTWRAALEGAFRPELDVSAVLEIVIGLLRRAFLPLAVAAGATVAATLGVHLLITRMGLSLKKLSPDFKR